MMKPIRSMFCCLACSLMAVQSLQPAALFAMESLPEEQIPADETIPEQSSQTFKQPVCFVSQGCIQVIQALSAERPSLDQLTAQLVQSLEAVDADGNTFQLSIHWKARLASADIHDSNTFWVEFEPDTADLPYEIQGELPWAAAAFALESEAQPDNGIQLLSQQTVTFSANERVIYQFLRDELGLNIAASCGVLANLQDESGFNPLALNGNDTGGTQSFGICQWNSGYNAGNRYGQLVTWCGQNGLDYRSLEGQLQFMKHELESNSYFQFARLKTAYNNTAEGASSAAYHWASIYEGVNSSRYAPRMALAKGSYWPVYSAEADQMPNYHIDMLEVSYGRIRLSGWSYDPDDPSASLSIQVQIGAQTQTIAADQQSPDVNAAFGISGRHRFSAELKTSASGNTPVILSVLNAHTNTPYVIYNNTLEMKQDVNPPKISQMKAELNDQGYLLTFKIEDEDDLSRVQLAAWTDKNGQDDLIADWGHDERCKAVKRSDGLWQVQVNTADHNNETGLYHNHLYAWDASGNQSGYPITVRVPHPDQERPLITCALADKTDAGYSLMAQAFDNDRVVSVHAVLTNSTSGQSIQKDLVYDSSDQFWKADVTIQELNFEVEGWTASFEAEDACENKSIQVETILETWQTTMDKCSHELLDREIVKDPCCTQSGIEIASCRLCPMVRMQTLQPLGETCAEWTTAKEAEYDQEGLEELRCTVCDNVLDSRSIPAGNVGKMLFRLYNPHSGEHFYTSDGNEQAYLVKVGWKDENTAWRSPTISSVPIYRLYNPNGGDHHYTADLNERDQLVIYGWKYEGICWYGVPQDDNSIHKEPVYRLYNPNAKTGYHHYTTSLEEYEKLIVLGWKPEGIAWYAIAQ